MLKKNMFATDSNPINAQLERQQQRQYFVDKFNYILYSTIMTPYYEWSGILIHLFLLLVVAVLTMTLCSRTDSYIFTAWKS